MALTGSLAGNHRALAQDQEIDWAYDEAALAALGYPAIEIAVSEDGVEAPDTLPAGIYHVTLSVSAGNNAYVDFMQPPAGLSVEEMTQGALDAGANDLVQPGWAFAGGGNTPEAGISATFLIELAPGDYQIAASYYPELAEGEEYDVANEIMQLSPLTVTGRAATPVASPVAETGATPVAGDPSIAPDADVTLEMTDDLRYIVTPDPVPAGPQLWEITNTGTEHSHHVVMYGVPDGTTADDIVADFASLMSGTPPAPNRPCRLVHRRRLRGPAVRRPHDLERARPGSGLLRGDLLHHRPDDWHAARPRRHGDRLHRRIDSGFDVTVETHDDASPHVYGEALSLHPGQLPDQCQTQRLPKTSGG